MFNNDTKELQELLRTAGSGELAQSQEAGKAIAQTIGPIIRKTVLTGDITQPIFESVDYTTNPNVIYPLDLLRPGTERDFVAFTMPDHGRIPSARVESDYIMVPTYRVANAIECTRRFLRDANLPVVQRMVEVLEAGFKKKLNDDAWATIFAAAKARNIIVADGNAGIGQFTPRLVSLMKTLMRRNGGGNSTSINRGKLTHLFVSPEGKDDIRSWGLDLVPDSVRANIYNSNDNGQELLSVYGVSIMDLDELGEGQEYQQYLISQGVSLPASRLEFAVGIDKSQRDNFIMPIREDMKVFENILRHVEGVFEMYATMELGFACLDNRKVLLGAF